nr:alpha/beta fold hydrolase [Actinacidiphila paucisporea]
MPHPHPPRRSGESDPARRHRSPHRAADPTTSPSARPESAPPPEGAGRAQRRGHARGRRDPLGRTPGGQPPRIYVHGLGGTSPAAFTEAAAHPLLAGRRSLLIDLLGHGLSDRPAGFDYRLESHADALATALAAAGVTGADVIGHSMGGSVAIVLAVRHPRLVARLVLADRGPRRRRPRLRAQHHAGQSRGLRPGRRRGARRAGAAAAGRVHGWSGDALASYV